MALKTPLHASALKLRFMGGVGESEAAKDSHFKETGNSSPGQTDVLLTCDGQSQRAAW